MLIMFSCMKYLPVGNIFRCSVNLRAICGIYYIIKEKCPYFGNTVCRVKFLNLKMMKISISSGERRGENKVTV